MARRAPRATPVHSSAEAPIRKLLIFIGITVGGWVGWALGERFGLVTAMIVSTLGSIAGIFVAWRIGRDWLA